LDFVEGRNLALEYRWAEGRNEPLPELAADLVRRRVSVIAATGGVNAVLAAKAATATLPIVFIATEDPVALGYVASISRPDANLTGINVLNGELSAKRLEQLHQMVPSAKRIAVLNNSIGRSSDRTSRDMEPAARALGLELKVVNASTSQEINQAFKVLARERTDALFVGNDPFLTGRRVQIVQVAAHYSVPAIYSSREQTEVGGLMSYGANFIDAYRQAGAYAGRILKGERPADLPILQSSKFELVINAETARMLDLTLPPTLVATADEVIE
jgi:putative ABC transport system substrate-binding protein